MTPKPSVLFVPGFWEGPAGVFADSISLLRNHHGFANVNVASLASTGHAGPGGPTLQDDVASVRSFIEPVVSQGKELVLVLHSAAGFIGSASTQDLTRKERKEAGLEGGIVAMAFIAAGIFPLDYVLQPLPFFDIRDGYIYCVNPRQLLFEGFDEEDAAKWIQKLQPQPSDGGEGTIVHAGWMQCRSWYLICEKDQVLPVEFQKQIAGLADATLEYCSEGHMVIINHPEIVV